MIKHAFVIGVTGLLGGQIVRTLVARNIEVSALVRSREKAAKMFGNLQIDFVEGDILQPESYRAGLKGCDALFHTAAFFRDALKGGKHWQTLYNTNVVGTKNLLQVAYEQGVRRVVHITGEIITTPFSFVATTSSIVWEGCTPIFVDICPDSLCIDADKIEAAITEKTQAILATQQRDRKSVV